jgi:hypothetical protein
MYMHMHMHVVVSRTCLQLLATPPKAHTQLCCQKKMVASFSRLALACVLLGMSHACAQSITIDGQGTTAIQPLPPSKATEKVQIISTTENLKSAMDSETASMVLFTEGEDDAGLQFLMLLAGQVWNSSSSLNWAYVNIQALPPGTPTREPGLWLFTSTHPRATGLRLPMELTAEHGVAEAVHIMEYVTDALKRSSCFEVCADSDDQAGGLTAGCWWVRNDGSHADPRKVIAKKKAEAAARLKAMEADIAKLKAEL